MARWGLQPYGRSSTPGHSRLLLASCIVQHAADMAVNMDRVKSSGSSRTSVMHGV